MSVVYSLIAFVVVLGVLVTVHEFGHFWVARRLGVKILRFSVGFGRPLLMRKFGSDETEFVLAAVPLGGYVKMLDEREGTVSEAERHRAFNCQSPYTRSAIAVAGPLANFLFAALAYFAMFMIGISGVRPIIGTVEPDSMASSAGFSSGEEIVAVAGVRTRIWDSVWGETVKQVFRGERTQYTVRGESGFERYRDLDFVDFDAEQVADGMLFDKIGLKPQRVPLPAVLGELLPGRPAMRAGFQPGDRVLAVDGIAVGDWYDWVEVIRAHPALPMMVRIERAGQTRVVRIVPELVETKNGTIGRIGAYNERPTEPWLPPMDTERYAPGAALAKAFAETWDYSGFILKILGKMLSGGLSTKHLSGPITIAQYAGQSASLGLAVFFEFLARVSLSLAVFNILPIPLLDGGILVTCLAEILIKRPVPEGVQIAGQQIGFVLLLGLMGLAFYNDLVRLL